MFAVSLTACGIGNKETALPKEGVIEKSDGDLSTSDGQQSRPSLDGEKTDSGSKILITYFTVPETDGVDTMSGASRVAKDGEVLGNTEFIAKEIQKNLGGDLFAIETVQKYPGCGKGTGRCERMDRRIIKIITVNSLHLSIYLHSLDGLIK